MGELNPSFGNHLNDKPGPNSNTCTADELAQFFGDQQTEIDENGNDKKDDDWFLKEVDINNKDCDPIEIEQDIIDITREVQYYSTNDKSTMEDRQCSDVILSWCVIRCLGIILVLNILARGDDEEEESNTRRYVVCFMVFLCGLLLFVRILLE